MATEEKEVRQPRVVAIAIDNSEYAEKAFDWYLEKIRRDDDVIVLIHIPESYDFSLAREWSPVALQKEAFDFTIPNDEVEFSLAKRSVVSLGLPVQGLSFMLMIRPGVMRQLLDELEKSVKALEDKFADKVKAVGIDGKFRTGAGKPGEAIIKIAKEENATMIITGTRGLGKIRRTVLGSVSDYVIHHSPVPVLVCRM